MKTAVLATLALAACLTAGAVCAAENITPEQAREIALAQTGGAGVIVESDIDYRRNSGVVYEFEIRADNVEFEIAIDGVTGNVLEFSREEEGRRSRRPAAAPRLTAVEAQAIALEEADGGSVTRYRLDRDDGRLVHEVTVFREGTRYRVEIDDADSSVRELSVRQGRNRAGN